MIYVARIFFSKAKRNANLIEFLGTNSISLLSLKPVIHRAYGNFV